MSTRARLRRLVGVTILSAGLLGGVASAQAPVPVFGDGTIPDQPIATRSLFLMCNPAWLLDKETLALRDVFWAYRAFARTSGNRHAAVWFVNSRLGSDPTTVATDPKNLDIERNVSDCRRFELKSSEGPHIVVTTTHPDRWTADTATPPTQTGDSIVVLALGASAPNHFMELLKKLNDQVLAERLSQQEVASAQYFLSWVRALEKACKVLDNVKFIVKARVFSVEKTGLCT